MSETIAIKFLGKRVSTTDRLVNFVLGNGQILVGELDKIPPNILLELTLHGLSQKIGDSAAGCAKDKAYGAALSAMTAVYDGLKAGKWGAEREATGGQLVADLIAAIAKLKRMDVEAVGAAVRTADEATVKGWLKNAKIAAEVADIRAKRLKVVAKDVEEDFEFTV